MSNENAKDEIRKRLEDELKNNSIDYASSVHSYAWGKTVKFGLEKYSKSASKYTEKFVGRKFGFVDAIFSFGQDRARGESFLQASLSSGAGALAGVALSEIAGPGAALVLGPMVSRRTNDFVDIIFGDKQKRAALLSQARQFDKAYNSIGSKIANLFRGNSKGFFKGVPQNPIQNKLGRPAIYAGIEKNVFKNAISWLGHVFKGLKFHSGGVVPGRGDVMAILKGGETVRTEEQERALQEALAKRYSNNQKQQQEQKSNKNTLLPRLSKEDDQYVIGLIIDAYRRNRYGFRNALRS